MRSKGNVKNSIARQFYKRFCQKSTVVKFEMGDGVKQRKNRWMDHAWKAHLARLDCIEHDHSG